MANKKISELTDLPTPADADLLAIADTSATETKKLSWTNLKATVKTYFDTIYAALSHTHTASDITDFDTEVSNNTDVAANTAKVTESTTVSSPLVLTGYDISIPVATSSANGYLSSADWATFNGKQDALPIVDTTALVKGDLDATKQVRLDVGGLTTATTRVLTVPDKDFTIAGTDDLHDAVTIGTANGLSLSVQVLSLAAASSTVTGALTSTDWTTFNNKANSGANSDITSLSGLTTPLSAAQGGTGLDTSASSGIPKIATGTWSINATQDDLGDGTTYKQYNPTSVAITGGSISGITDLAVADGGTGASDAATARTNLGVDKTTLGYMTDLVDDATPQLGGELDAGAHSIGFTLQTATGVVGTTTIDWKLGNKFKFTFGAGNETLAFTAPTKPGNFVLMIVQDSTGGRTITWPATVKWPGGTAPTLSTAASAVDIVSFLYDGTNYYGVASLNFS